MFFFFNFTLKVVQFFILMANCPVGKTSCRRSVLSANRPVGKTSYRRTVLSTSCPVDELSLSTNCPVGELFGMRTVCRWNVCGRSVCVQLNSELKAFSLHSVMWVEPSLTFTELVCPVSPSVACQTTELSRNYLRWFMLRSSQSGSQLFLSKDIFMGEILHFFWCANAYSQNTQLFKFIVCACKVSEHLNNWKLHLTFDNRLWLRQRLEWLNRCQLCSAWKKLF